MEEEQGKKKKQGQQLRIKDIRIMCARRQGRRTLEEFGRSQEC